MRKRKRWIRERGGGIVVKTVKVSEARRNEGEAGSRGGAEVFYELRDGKGKKEER